MFAPELIAAYPEAKVVLSNRNVDQWYRYETADILERKPLTFAFHLMQVHHTYD